MASGAIIFMGPEVIVESKPSDTFQLRLFSGIDHRFFLGFNISIFLIYLCKKFLARLLDRKALWPSPGLTPRLGARTRFV
jgi:hypothetical protein